MKKFFSLLLAISFSLGAFSQMGKVTSALSFIEQNLLDKAKESLDQALVNEKSKDNPKTYFAKGKLAQACFKSENATFKALYPNPLDTAYASYEKALKLDQKGSIEKQYKLNSIYLYLANDYIAQGVKAFEGKEYEPALAAFESNIKISASPNYIGAIDTGIYFNAGLAAYNAKLYDRAVPHFQKCIELKYEGTTPWFLLYNCFIIVNTGRSHQVTIYTTGKNGNPSQSMCIFV